MYTLSSPVREKLKSQLAKLLSENKWDYIRTWFGVWETVDGVPTELGLEEMVHKCHLWGYLCMPEFFRARGCDAHLELIRCNLSKINEYNAFPRGAGKTSILELCIAFECANGTQKFIPVIEKSWEAASEILATIREVFSSEIVKKIYGGMIGRTVTGVEAEKSPDAKGDIFINGVRLRGVGFDKTIRGLKTGAWRPTKIYVDDVEIDVHVGNPEQRVKYVDNYTKGIIPALDIQIGSVKVCGTILHYDSLLLNLINQHKGNIFKAYNKFDPKHTLLWADYLTYEVLEKKKEEMMTEGARINAFYQEYLNEPISEEERDFHWDDITKTYKESDLKFKELNLYAALDMAQAADGLSDYTGVAVEAVDKDGNWYNRLTKRYKKDILGVIDLIFELWQIPNMRKIGVEKLAFDDQLKPLLKKESEKRGVYPVVVELKHRGKRKIDRIKGALQARYVQGRIFNKENPEDDTKLLWEELYSMGGGIIAAKNDDLMDAKAYISDLVDDFAGGDYKTRWKKSGRVRRKDPLKEIRSTVSN